MNTLLLIAAIALTLYILAIAALVIAGRHQQARELAAGTVALLRRSLTDPRVPRRWKLAIVLTLAYLACPIDLVPDFIPVAGHIDDVIIVALLLRGLKRVTSSP
jgi:uncharacterized membrane protein YkvA (DUF1232 family)